MRPLIPGIESVGHSYSWDKRQAKLSVNSNAPQAIPTVGVVFFCVETFQELKTCRCPCQILAN